MEKRCAELNNLNLALQWGAIGECGGHSVAIPTFLHLTNFVLPTGDVGVFAQKFGNMAVAGLVPQRIYSCLKSLDKIMNFRGIPILSCVTLTDESKMNGLGNGMDIVKTGGQLNRF